MSVISRLLKLVTEPDASEEREEGLADDAEAGLFISTGPQEGSSDEALPPIDEADEPSVSEPEAAADPPQGEDQEVGTDASADVIEDSAADGAVPEEAPEPEAVPPDQGEPDDLPEAADEGEDAASESSGDEGGDALDEASSAEGDAMPQEQAGDSGPADEEDDLLSAFRGAAEVAGTADLTKDMEDVPAGALLAELSEIRGMLPLPPAVPESSHEEDVAA